MSPPSKDSCDCGRALPYIDCCGRYHQGALAPDAESLMRSRYSAYVRANADYLLSTWHCSTRPVTLEAQGLTGINWLGLIIKQHLLIDGDHAQVEFVARSRVGGAPAQRLHEISRFVREAGRWYYVDGEYSN